MEEKESYQSRVDAVTKRKLQPDLACWILNLMARQHNSLIDELLFTAETFKSLRSYFIAASADNKSSALLLLSNMLQSVSKVTSVAPGLVEEILALRNCVVDIASELYKKETKGGTSLQNASRLMQLMVQLIVVIDSTLATLDSQLQKISPSSLASNAASSLDLPKGIVALTGGDDTNLHALDGKGLLRWLPEGSAENIETANARRLVRRQPVPETGDPFAGKYTSALCKHGFESGRWVWDIRVVDYFTAGADPIVGLAKLPFSPLAPAGPTSDRSSTSEWSITWGGRNLYVCSSEPIAFGPKVSAGDVLSIELDLNKGTVSFYRNRAFVGLAVGPPNSGAVVEASIGSGPFYPCVRSVCFISKFK